MQIDKNIIFIFGPTASGKSSLALKLAQEDNGVIFNADSMQIYQELPILSSQPTMVEQKIVPHFFYGFLNYQQGFSVAKWLELISPKIKKELQKGKKCFIVGGTGLYFSSLYYGINKMPQISQELKQEMRDLYNDIGNEKFIEFLTNLGDQNTANLDGQRLIRRAEILKETGKDLTFWQNQPKEIFFDQDQIKIIKLIPERQELYQKCNKRFEFILENGAIEEVEKLSKLNPDPKNLISKMLGYKEINCYLNNLLTKEEMIEIVTKKIRNYAKRQITWFKNQFPKN
jgi:tRNA dimethylallyltransferase|tara:strand:- start:2355 stop:3212 length:858 start_codon:yes stop_codon:yes gene_type:complete